MKKYFAIALLCLPATALTCVSCLCKSMLDIVVQNNTDADCYLTQQTIDSGISFTKALPLHIPAGQTSPAYSIWGPTVDVTLGFQCGGNKYATFATLLGNSAQPKTITGTTISLANLDADFNSIPAACDTVIPTARKVIWTLQ
jgi:hypothetical protein